MRAMAYHEIPIGLFDRTVDVAALCELDWQWQTFAIAVADFAQHIRSFCQWYSLVSQDSPRSIAVATGTLQRNQS